MMYRPERELVAQAIAAGIPAEEAEATIVKLHTAYERVIALNGSIRIPGVGRLFARKVKPAKGRYFGAKPRLCAEYGKAALTSDTATLGQGAIVWAGEPGGRTRG